MKVAIKKVHDKIDDRIWDTCCSGVNDPFWWRQEDNIRNTFAAERFYLSNILSRQVSSKVREQAREELL